MPISNSEFISLQPPSPFTQVQNKESEPDNTTNNLSCGTRFFKWVVRHPYQAAAGTVVALGLAGGSIYGFCLMGTAVSAKVVLSNRNITSFTNETSTTVARTDNVATTTAAPVEYHRMTCSGNTEVNPVCTGKENRTWASYDSGRSEGLTLRRMQGCTDQTGYEEYMDFSVEGHDSTELSMRYQNADKFCAQKGWGQAEFFK